MKVPHIAAAGAGVFLGLWGLCGWFFAMAFLTAAVLVIALMCVHAPEPGE